MFVYPGSLCVHRPQSKSTARERLQKFIVSDGVFAENRCSWRTPSPSFAQQCCGYVASVARRLLLLSLLDVSPSITVYDCVCGFVEGSIARAHSLPWGWLKAAHLFAYQIYCGSEKHWFTWQETDWLHLNRPRREWERRISTARARARAAECMWASRRMRRQRAVLKLAWRQADALQICVGVFMKTLALKCVFNYVCVEREERSGSPSPIFIFTSIHEHLTPCRVCRVPLCMCMCVSSDHMPASPLYTSAGWDAYLFFLPSVVTESLLWSHYNPIIKQWCTFYHAGLAGVVMCF